MTWLPLAPTGGHCLAMTPFHSRLDKDEIFWPVASFLCNSTSIGIGDCLVLMTSCCVHAQPLRSDSEAMIGLWNWLFGRNRGRASFVLKRCIKYSWSCSSGCHGNTLKVSWVLTDGYISLWISWPKRLSCGLKPSRGHRFCFLLVFWSWF